MKYKTLHPFEINNPLNINKRRVLREIWLKDGISRIEISKKLDLDKSTITKIANQLLSNNYILTTTIGNTGPMGGRKPVSLSIDKNKGCFLGIELQTEKCSALLVDLHGEIISEHTSIYKSDSIESVISSIGDINNSLIDIPELLAVGIGVSGIVNNTTGTIIKSYPFNIKEEYDLGNKLDSLFSCPVIIENDANCGCWGELVSNKNDRHSNMLYITGELHRKKRIDGQETGAGIGLGIVMNDNVLHGSGFSVGEFRSVMLENNDKDQFLKKAVPMIIDELSSNIAMIINTFNITELILGGGLYQYGPEIIETFSNKTNQNWAYSGPADCIYRFSKYKEKDVAFGAAAMCLEQYFSV